MQAPAGSGKTQILTSRVLNLLANAVSSPEEILAITFTNKAAKEMLHRIKSALLLAYNSNPIPKDDPLKYDLWELACKVKIKDEKYNWNLTTAINRINIMTFDSFCARLTNLMPHLSKLGGSVQMATEPSKLYEKAAISLIKDKNSPLWDKALPDVLLPLNNNIEKFIRLSIDLLSKREQWLPLISSLNMHNQNFDIINDLLNSSINQLHESMLDQAEKIFEKIPIKQKNILFELLDFMLNELNKEFNSQNININNLQDISDIFLTKDGSWRSKLTKKQGIISNADIKKIKDSGDITKAEYSKLIKISPKSF